MSPVDIETILKFYMEKLPENDLAELDDRLAGGTDSVPSNGMASDSKRRAYLALDARSRQAVRKVTRDRAEQAVAPIDDPRFPNMNRLK